MRAFSIAAIVAVAACASGCSVPKPKPVPDPYSPWFHIPHPIACNTGKGCQQWDEPGMMVKD